jgi:hypothetical protein
MLTERTLTIMSLCSEDAYLEGLERIGKPFYSGDSIQAASPCKLQKITRAE